MARRAASPEQWLAETSGCTESAARAAASVDPGSEARLLSTAARRAHRDRHLRVWHQGAATHGSFSGPTADVADLIETREPLTDARFDAARKAEPRESQDAYRFDALVDLARSGGNATGVRPKHAARVRVDLSALLRGHTEPGETCEIPGVGPVPVSHVREVLAHGLLQLVITDGVDIQTVVSTTRHVPTALKIALAERDRTCKILGCDCDRSLHRHHVERFADGGLTTYKILGNPCARHHHFVHDEGYAVVIDEDGTWDHRAPPSQAAA